MIDMRLADEPQDGRHRWELVPNLGQTARRQVIEPRGSAKFDVRYFDSAGEIAWPEGDMIVSIEFRDSRGLVWRRANDDEPVRKKQSADGLKDRSKCQRAKSWLMNRCS